MLFAIFMACAAPEEIQECDTKSVDNEDSSLGFAGFEVWSVVSDELPTSAEWYPGDWEAPGTETDVDFKGFEDIQILTCGKDKYLRTPMNMDINMFGGSLVAEGQLIVDASAADSVDDLVIRTSVFEADAAFGYEFDGIVRDYYRATGVGETYLDTVTVEIGGPWSDATIKIETTVSWGDTSITETLFKGRWAL